jgi:hypothetical protein
VETVKRQPKERLKQAEEENGFEIDGCRKRTQSYQRIGKTMVRELLSSSRERG